MRLSDAVRVGGRLALVIGFVVMNLVFGNSLSYYYGYSSAEFGNQPGTDALASQNVSFTPQVGLVSSVIARWSAQGDNSVNGGSGMNMSLASAGASAFTMLASVYGYSAPVTQAPTYSPSDFSNTFSNTTWSPVQVAVVSTMNQQLTSGWSPVTPGNQAYNQNIYSMPVSPVYSGSAYPTYQSGMGSYIGGWYTVPIPPPPPSGDMYEIVYGSYVPPQTFGGFQSVAATVLPSVTPQISAASLPAALPPASALPVVNLTNFGFQQFEAPEPGTLLLVPAGLGLLVLKLRRRR